MSEAAVTRVACACRLGESPCWSPDDGALYWLDIRGQQLHRLDLPDGGHTVRALPWLASAVAPAGPGRLVMATVEGIGLFHTASGDFTRIATLDDEPAGNRPNEGKCDPQGRFWVGTMDDAEAAATGCLYRVDPDGGVTRFVEGVGITNTLAWTPDGTTLYFADSAAQTVYAFDWDGVSGTIRNRRAFVSLRGEPFGPDGSAIDAEGGLWNCQWDGARVVRYAPDGSVDRVVSLPVSRPASCCFGGPALDTLFITTARIGLDDAQLAREPEAGNLFACQPGVRGVAETPFAVDEARS